MHKNTSKSRSSTDRMINNESGMAAIILVLWIVVLLVSIVGEFSFSMRTEKNIARNFKEEEEAYQLALAGIEAAKIEVLLLKESEKMHVNSDNILIFDDDKGVPERKAVLGRGSLEYVITDEEGKLNINNATKDQLRYIFINSGVESSDADIIVDSIIDWRDKNDLHQLNGAEEDYYRSLDKPYSSKDGSFDSIEELLLVKGMTHEIFYGSSKVEDNSSENPEEQAYSGVADLLTVYGTRININTASVPVIEAVMGIETANLILTQREEGSLGRPVGNSKITSDFFNIVSSGINGDGTIRRSVKAILKRNKEDFDIIYWKDNYTG